MSGLWDKVRSKLVELGDFSNVNDYGGETIPIVLHGLIIAGSEQAVREFVEGQFGEHWSDFYEVRNI